MRLSSIHKFHWRSLIGAVFCLLIAMEVQAAPLRVTTWNMEPKGAMQTNGAGTATGLQTICGKQPQSSSS